MARSFSSASAAFTPAIRTNRRSTITIHGAPQSAPLFAFRRYSLSFIADIRKGIVEGSSKSPSRNALGLPDHPLQFLRPRIGLAGFGYARQIGQQLIERDFSSIGVGGQPFAERRRDRSKPQGRARLFEQLCGARVRNRPFMFVVLLCARRLIAHAHGGKWSFAARVNLPPCACAIRRRAQSRTTNMNGRFLI